MWVERGCFLERFVQAKAVGTARGGKDPIFKHRMPGELKEDQIKKVRTHRAERSLVQSFLTELTAPMPTCERV